MAYKAWMTPAAAIAAAAMVMSSVAPVFAEPAAGLRATVVLDEATIARAVAALPAPIRTRSDASDWSRVTSLKSGGEIVITTDNAAELLRRFVAADAATVTLLDVTGDHLPGDVKRVFRQMATRSPHELALVASGASVTYVRGRVRLGPEGVFFEGQRVADIASLVTVVARGEVVEIKHRPDRNHPLLSAGFIVGATLLALGTTMYVYGRLLKIPEPPPCRSPFGCIPELGLEKEIPMVIGTGIIAAGTVVTSVSLLRQPSDQPPAVYRRP